MMARTPPTTMLAAIIRREKTHRSMLRRLTIASLLLIASELLVILLAPLLALAGVLWMGAPGYVAFCATIALGSTGACQLLASCACTATRRQAAVSHAAHARARKANARLLAHAPPFSRCLPGWL